MNPLQHYYSWKKDSVFLNQSLNCPTLKPHELWGIENKIPERKSHRHIPWNHQLHAENMANMFTDAWHNKEHRRRPKCLPPVQVINLDTRIDRLAEFNYVNKFNMLRPERFNAVKAKPGYIGCALSHLSCIKQAKERGDDMVIVIEDDCMFTVENWEERLLQVLAWLEEHKDEWEVFNSIPIGTNVDRVDKVLERDLGIVRTCGGLNTQFIIYNSSCYDRLLNMIPVYLEPRLGRGAEMFLAWDELLSRNCTMVSCIPLLTNAFSYDSDLTLNGIAHEQPMKNFLKIDEWYGKNLHQLCPMNPFNRHSDITVVMTSTNRYAELTQTLDSLLQNLSYPVKEIIVSEENYEKYIDRFSSKYSRYDDPFGSKPSIRMIKGKGNHMDSLDQLYSMVTTKYVFHMEEDWTCVQPFFLEQSKSILESDSKVLQVWLRDLNDTNMHPIGDYHKVNGYHTFKMEYGYSGNWHGFSFNPGLKRTVDLVKFSDYKDGEGIPEERVSQHYKDRGMYALILPCAFFYHTGYASTYHGLWKLSQSLR